MVANGSEVYNGHVNPYVKNPFIFANHSAHKFLAINAIISFWNYNLVAISGAFLNITVLYLVIFRTPAHLKPYSRMLLLCCCADLYYLLMDHICKPRLKISDGALIYATSGIISSLSHEWQCFGISLLCGGMIFCCTVLPTQFYYRYCLMAKNLALSIWHVIFLGALSFFLSMTLVAIDTPGYIFSALERPQLDYGQLWYHESPVPILIILDSRSYLSLTCIAYAVFITNLSYSLTIYFFWKTMHEMKKAGKIAEINEQTTKLQAQFTRVLLIQATIPLFTAVSPIVIALAAVFLRLETGYMGEICIMLLSWLPVLNPLATILLLPPYRNLIFRFVSTGSFEASKKVHVEVTNTSKDSTKGYKPRERLKDQRCTM